MSNEIESNKKEEAVEEMMKEAGQEMLLDDARRIKSLSPGMLVFKRFIRNKLAVVGLAILVFMFTFSFLGPLFSPYEQAQYFTGLSSMFRDYAGAIYNTELRHTVAEGENFGSAERAQFLLAVSEEEETFTFGNAAYYITGVGENTYRISQLDPVAEELLGQVNPLAGTTMPDGLVEAYEAAREADENNFELDGVTYRITRNRKTMQISTERDVALATLNVYDAYDESNVDLVNSFEFKYSSESAIDAEETTFVVGEQSYSIDYLDGVYTIRDSDGENFAAVSEIIVNPLDQNEFLTVDFKSAIRQGIRNDEPSVVYTHSDGESIEYIIEQVNQNYYIKKDTPTELIRQYEAPSVEHPLGLDNNGMDNMTRLMYGGRVSLLVGFVVVILEILIGVIVGGISGYFGGPVDTALMRFVDLFNSIPFYPVVIIFGSVMDTLQVDPMGRIFLLMAVLGILGWTGIARVVRGQILSLREQEFMIATEATGIRTSRRIFRHLVPNVMPLLIVQATAGLGGIIISEATLGFLGLGVKFPLASWGSIINIASDAYVMTNFWYMWIPAGMLILLTVLGFNFVGDGLRDAFDPKMKR
jgi:peptide/nickel transport system permease protein